MQTIWKLVLVLILTQSTAMAAGRRHHKKRHVRPPKPIPTATIPAETTDPLPVVDLFAEEPGSVPIVNTEADKLASEAALRRSRLSTHQLLGTTTWGLMLVTTVLGQLNYSDEYGGGSRSGNYLWPHRIGSYLTTLSFTAAGIYALLAPTPYKRPMKFDTAFVHKAAVIGATAGMVAQIVLGFWTARQADAGNPRGLKDRAKLHQILGYSTFGMLTVAQASWLF
jgi:hypothetical protein